MNLAFLRAADTSESTSERSSFTDLALRRVKLFSWDCWSRLYNFSTTLNSSLIPSTSSKNLSRFTPNPTFPAADDNSTSTKVELPSVRPLNPEKELPDSLLFSFLFDAVDGERAVAEKHVKTPTPISQHSSLFCKQRYLKHASQ
ncbi:hypothetical protein NE237_003396 [Protea cynaroides]|uniref:Uncharacterized protein n=1 Tax=Protea cynaroides TaxID=273540 RepID=A0A9Q0KGX1_9MAGN|nr:hypothetical protein NE237_003396 [Protea cynaroides]